MIENITLKTHLMIQNTLIMPGELLGTVKNLAPRAIIQTKNPPEMIYKPARMAKIFNEILSMRLRN